MRGSPGDFFEDGQLRLRHLVAGQGDSVRLRVALLVSFQGGRQHYECALA
jgi:hypothetical protein